MFHSRSGWHWVVVFGLLVGCGSSSDVEQEQAQAEQALGIECLRAQSTIFTNGISVTSPRTYNPPSCYKGQVYDVMDYEQSASGTFGGGGAGPTVGTASTVVTWADDAPTLAACPNAWVASDLFLIVHEGSSGGSGPIASRSGYGRVAGGACELPSVTWDNTIMPPGRSYRVTATARTSNTSAAPTRRVSTQSFLNGVPTP